MFIRNIKLKQYAKIILPLIAISVLAGCDNSSSQSNSSMAQSIRVVLSDNNELQPNQIYRTTVYLSPDSLPKIGYMLVNDKQQKQLIIPNGNKTVLLEENNKKWQYASNSEKIGQVIDIKSIEIIDNSAYQPTLTDGTYFLGIPSNNYTLTKVSFMLVNDNLIASEPNVCTLTGDISDKGFTGMYQISTPRLANCSNNTLIEKAYLLAYSDDTPAQYQLIYSASGKLQSAYVFKD